MTWRRFLLVRNLRERSCQHCVNKTLRSPIGAQSASVLRAAVELGRMPLQKIYFEATPAGLIGIANETVEKDLLLRNAIAEFSPVLELFKLDGKCPATSLDAIAKAVIASTKISQEHRSALYLNRSVDVAAFGSLRERWVAVSLCTNLFWLSATRIWSHRCSVDPDRARAS